MLNLFQNNVGLLPRRFVMKSPVLSFLVAVSMLAGGVPPRALATSEVSSQQIDRAVASSVRENPVVELGDGILVHRETFASALKGDFNLDSVDADSLRFRSEPFIRQIGRRFIEVVRGERAVDVFWQYTYYVKFNFQTVRAGMLDIGGEGLLFGGTGFCRLRIHFNNLHNPGRKHGRYEIDECTSKRHGTMSTNSFLDSGGIDKE